MRFIVDATRVHPTPYKLAKDCTMLQVLTMRIPTSKVKLTKTTPERSTGWAIALHKEQQTQTCPVLALLGMAHMSLASLQVISMTWHLLQDC